MIYTVTFNPAIDYIVHTDEMETGGVIRSSREEIYIGRKRTECFPGIKRAWKRIGSIRFCGRVYRGSD